MVATPDCNHVPSQKSYSSNLVYAHTYFIPVYGFVVYNFAFVSGCLLTSVIKIVRRHHTATTSSYTLRLTVAVICTLSASTDCSRAALCPHRVVFALPSTELCSFETACHVHARSDRVPDLDAHAHGVHERRMALCVYLHLGSDDWIL